MDASCLKRRALHRLSCVRYRSDTQQHRETKRKGTGISWVNTYNLTTTTSTTINMPTSDLSTPREGTRSRTVTACWSAYAGMIYLDDLSSYVCIL